MEDLTGKQFGPYKIVDQLVALGVDCIYGIPGDSNLPLIDAIRRDGRA